MCSNMSVRDMWQLCGESVEVRLVTGSSVFGVVYTIDPVSLSVVLVQFVPDQGAETMQLIPGDSIASIDRLPLGGAPCCTAPSDQLSAWLAHLFRDDDVSSDINADKQRQRILGWLTENYVPVDECADGSLSILNDVRIVAPFTINDCQCTNETVLAKVRNILQSIPDDYRR